MAVTNYLTYTHKSGRLIDRLVTTPNITKLVENVVSLKKYMNSDHFPVIAELKVTPTKSQDDYPPDQRLCWNKANHKAIQSYMRLHQFNNNEI